MTHHPRALKSTAFFLVLVALSFPIQVAVIYGHMPWETSSIFAKISNLNWIVMGFCLLNASLIYRAASVSRYMVPALMAVVGFNNGVVSSMADDYSLPLSLAGALAFAFCHIGLFKREITEVFQKPERRWWLTPPRMRLEVPLMLSQSRQEYYMKSTTFDVSESGTFVSYLKAPEPLTRVKVNDSFFVCMNLGSLTQLRCEAKVVRTSDATGKYPAGVGLKFMRLTANDKKRLKKFIHSHSKETTL